MPSASVSVIIPFIDEYAMLREAIASVEQQGDVVKEIIIVRNHSDPADTTQLPPSRFPVKVLHQPIRGAGYARNTGLHEATANWIQFLDVDDLLLPGKLSHQIQFHDAAAVVSPHLFRNLHGKEKKSKWLADDVWTGLLNSGLGSTSSMLWKREALLSVGGWSTTLQSHQEYDLLFRLLAAGNTIATLDTSETIVRQRKSGSITQLSKHVRSQEGLELREAMRNHLQIHDMLTPLRNEAFLQYVFRQLRGLYRSNKTLALEKHKAYFSNVHFIPKEIAVPGYGLVYKMLGFARTERLLTALVRVRDRVTNKPLMVRLRSPQVNAEKRR